MALATWRSALIAAIGVVLGLAGPLHAASSADTVFDASAKTSAIPTSMANANAPLRSSDTPAANDQSAATAETTPASTPDAQPAATNPVVAAAEAPAAREAPAQSSASEHSIWDETSLIGKIFIGFGALLTIASAARMFMA
jgi:hypothetical protein